jgi:hypothetical protein
MKPTIPTLLACSLALAVLPSVFAEGVPVGWLDGAPPASDAGVSFGVPWPRGSVSKGQAFALSTAEGKSLPVQTWPLAYWPDGSIKWIGVATVAGPGAAHGAILSAGAAANPAPTGPVLRVVRSDTAIEIDTGVLRCRINNWGNTFIESMEIDGREVARRGQLVCILQSGPDGDPVETPSREEYVGHVDRISVEQSGPVRAVVKIEGEHWGARSDRRWLPFVVRLYFYAGQKTVRVVHTIIYDGDQDRDFIRGLGVRFGVPMREEVQNRHVRFSGEGLGLWSEPVQPLVGRDRATVADPSGPSGWGNRRDVYPDQIEGKRVPNREKLDERSRKLLDDWAVWDSFKLVQPNADGFTVVKRTNAQSTWLAAGAGHRASGLVFVGDVSGGLGVSVKNFWQSFPVSLEVRGASSHEAELYAWLWSPDGPSMDLRHYDTRAHGLESVYEDVQPGFSTATGVARTSELTLFATDSVPTKKETAQQAHVGSLPPLLVATPEVLHSAGVFGVWSLPDRGTPLKKAVEDRLDGEIAAYEKEVEQRHWYGFWYYGNVMHSYDTVRHVWRYDLGGMAWDNTELASDMWLWYSFLRTGRADIYHMAEAMTRNTGEVDVYHLGRFAGLGSRHNVVPWGCGAKEARISQAAFRRFYYYLSTDERTGDLMREVLNVDSKVAEFDPMRLAQPPTAREKEYPARVRVGPDWFAFAGNWMTEWERTGDVKWRDKIYAGMNSLTQMPYGIRSGRNLVYGYDPASGKLCQVSDEMGDYNLATIQGGAEVVFELNQLIDNPAWQQAWLQYCRLERASSAVVRKDMQTHAEGADGSLAGLGRLAAYAYSKTGDAAFVRGGVAGLAQMLGMGRYQSRGPAQAEPRQPAGPRRIEGPDVLNPIDELPLGTNGVAQSSLTAIEVLQLCADRLPAEVPAPDSFAPFGPDQRREGGSAGDIRTPNN